jgi:DNA-binding NtrC family response regulator
MPHSAKPPTSDANSSAAVLSGEHLVGSLWQLAVARHSGFSLAIEAFSRLVSVLPLRSFAVLVLDPTPRTISANEPGSVTSALGSPLQSGTLQQLFLLRTHFAPYTKVETRECSDAHWIDLIEWADTGSPLIQPSPKRTGKLAWIAPEETAGSLIAIPLRPSTAGRSDSESSEVSGIGVRGIAVLEIELGRSLSPSLLPLLQEIGPPLAWMLQNTWAIPPGESADARVAQTVPATSKERVQDASEYTAEDRKTLRDLVVGAEEGLKAVMERVALVAPSELPILILGDTGTGKEVIARAIHARSPRAKQPFLRVNCGAIPPDLIDSQLFGHERGSFTGALDQRKGWFERANSGTLFLDEIGELPLAAQVRLLRVLQEHQIERVGGQQTMDVDVRIVAATHRDLATMVHERTFREDLWYRINLFPILLPRLCERLSDIPALAKHFAKKAASNFGVPFAEPTEEDLRRLQSYPWPGNVRELQAVIDRAVILGRGHHLDIATALGSGFMLQPPTSFPIESTIPKSPGGTLATNEMSCLSLNDMIKQHIERALVLAQGKIEGAGGAAELLEINPHTLRAKMRKLGIEWSQFRSR